MGSAGPFSRTTRALAAAIVLAVIATISTTVGDARAAPSSVAIAPAPAATFNTSAYQKNVLTYVNAHRRANGLAPLTLHWQLTSACQRHANDMGWMNRMTHVGSDGSNGGTRMLRAGFRWMMWGENIAVGYGASSSVVYAWMNSPGHRANILNPRFRYMGLGITFARGTIWWCQNLGV
jgi:uncharacterized protein YkwD